ncbi:MAG: UvrD-helicase domain-containing protein [Acidobacteriota bacterium]|jgi:ATP-dependent exoDNAse (exonuclease V) beta subunit|nr:UvrD-helicase domain-containing protein [Acidobacteriota bacterium]
MNAVYENSNAISYSPSGDGEARRRAVEETGRSFIMEASAGTGKTHTLISRILHLVLEKGPQGPPLRLAEICAITFTEKAADEMKARLRLELEKKLEDAAAPDAAGRILQALDDLETASVSTFHSFAAGLLKERPVEAGIDPRFSALDAIQCELFFRETWNAWIAAALKRREPALEKALRGGFSLKSLKSLAQNLRGNWPVIRELRCAAPDEERISFEIRNRLEEGRGLLRRLTNPNDRLAEILADALKWLENPDPAAGALKKPGGAGAQANWEGGKDTVKEAREFLKEAVELQTSFAQIPARRLTHETVQWLCADFLLKEWEKKKSASGYLDFDDQLYIARELLRRNDGVRAEFQERYKTLLVDEFQDTDPIQLEIVLLLTLKRGDSMPEPGRLFIVGDPKQSIYRFRGADIETYIGLAREEKLRAPGVERLTINRNFRSVPSILRFADEAFSEAIHPPDDGNYQSSYTAFNDEGARRDEPSAPSVHILGDGADENAERKTGELAALEAERIAKLIRRMRDSSLYRIPDAAARSGLRPARYGDIAILLPTLNYSDAMEDALREAGIPYVLEGGRFYYMRSEVGSAVTALESLSRPGDETALCGALKSVFFGISDEDLLRARVEGIAFDYRLPAPSSSPLCAPFEILRELHARRHERPASETFEILLRETGAREILAARGLQHLANLNKISRALRAIEGRNGFSRTIELLSILEKEGLNESESRLTEARSDAVRVMTIHKSKGLDFPIVIAASLGFVRKAQTKTLLADRHNLKMFAVKAGDVESGRRTEGWEELDEGDRRREDAELVRLLYVALTRARDHLILSTHTRKRKETDKGVFAPDVSGTRLAPLDGVLRKCASDETLARRIDAKLLDACVIPAATVPDHTVYGDGIESVAREYRELRELIENTRAGDFSRAAAENKEFTADAVENQAALARRRSVRLGTAFHEVMERVDLKGLTGLAELMDEAAERNNLNGASRRQLGDMVEKCLVSDLMRRAQAAAREGRRVLRETPFVRPLEEGGVEEGRIDLLFEEGDAWTLVDYKKGWIPKNIKEANDAETYFRNKYTDQAQAYRDALESMDIKVGGVFLLLARTGGVIEIS